MDGFQVTVLHEAPVGVPPRRLTDAFRISPLQHGGQEDLVGEEVGPLLGGEVLRAVRGRPGHLKVEGDRESGILPNLGPDGLAGQSMGQVQMVDGGQGLVVVFDPGGMGPVPITQVSRAPRLVQGGPGVHPIAEGSGQGGGVVAKTESCVPAGPTSGIL